MLRMNPTRRDTLLDMIIKSKEEYVENVKARGSNHDMVRCL